MLHCIPPIVYIIAVHRETHLQLLTTYCAAYSGGLVSFFPQTTRACMTKNSVCTLTGNAKLCVTNCMIEREKHHLCVKIKTSGTVD